MQFFCNRLYDENAKLKECKIVQYDVLSDNGKITSRKSQETSIQINELEYTIEKDYSIIGLLNNLPDGTLIEDQIQAVVFKKGEPDTLETIAEIEKRTKDAIANGTILRPQN